MLSIKNHEWNKTDASSFFQNVKTSSDFVAVWKQIQYSHLVPSDKETSLNKELPIASESSSVSSSSSSLSHQTSSLSNDSFPPEK